MAASISRERSSLEGTASGTVPETSSCAFLVKHGSELERKCAPLLERVKALVMETSSKLIPVTQLSEKIDELTTFKSEVVKVQKYAESFFSGDSEKMRTAHPETASYFKLLKALKASEQTLSIYENFLSTVNTCVQSKVVAGTPEELNLSRFSEVLIRTINNPLKWKRRHPLGEGACGTVLEGRIGTLLLAIKVFNSPGTTDKAQEKRKRLFLEEFGANLLLPVDCPYISQLLYANMNRYLLAFRKGRGSLLDLYKKERGIPVGELKRYASHILQALHALHSRGIVQSDIKPENVIVDKDGVAKLADFGFSRMSRQTVRGGTPEYSAPELQKKDALVEPANDIWSLGVLLLALVSGKVPFTEEDLTSPLFKKQTAIDEMVNKIYEEMTRNGNEKMIDPLLSILIYDCLNVDPTKRPSAAQLLANIFSITVKTTPTATINPNPRFFSDEGRAPAAAASSADRDVSAPIFPCEGAAAASSAAASPAATKTASPAASPAASPTATRLSTESTTLKVAP